MAASPYEILAYYFPQYHPDPRNDRWHGQGWTEWELVKLAQPRFPGHRQPIVPAWGYFDEADPAWTVREIDLAADHGITGFLYDWYWYEDGPFLIDGLDQGFLKAPNNARLKFALMWANHNWKNIHPSTFVNQQPVLAPGAVSRSVFDQMVDHIIDRYFPLPNHLTLDGKPYFSIYDVDRFVAGVGGLDQARAALADFRAKTVARGFPGLHMNVHVWGLNALPTSDAPLDALELVKRLEFDSIDSYCWLHHLPREARSFPTVEYNTVAEFNYRVWDEFAARFPVPYHPNVSMGWDSSPRTIQTDRYEDRGYPWSAVFANNTPAAFQAALERARSYLDQPHVAEKVLTINAWNEWTEGSYLLPDTVHGSAYVEAIRAVFGAM